MWIRRNPARNTNTGANSFLLSFQIRMPPQIIPATVTMPAMASRASAGHLNNGTSDNHAWVAIHWMKPEATRKQSPM